MNHTAFTAPIDRATLWHRHHREAAAFDKLVAAIHADTDAPATPTHAATPAGDERRLRGIPCIARGVPGHIPGTRP